VGKQTKRLVLYHRTTEDSADSILQGGFIDGEGSYMADSSLRGVFLSNRPLSADEVAGQLGEGAILKVTMATTLKDLQRYELREERKPYREWCIPADIVNSSANITRAQIETGGPPENYEAYVAALREVKSEP
jgi:hypothetical protein